MKATGSIDLACFVCYRFGEMPVGSWRKAEVGFVYILFAVLVSLAIYAAAYSAFRLTGQVPDNLWRVGLGSLLVLGAALVVFNLASRAVGVDLGPGHPVSYNIPDDYLARGIVGALALLPYLLACLSSAIAFALLRGGRQRLA